MLDRLRIWALFSGPWRPVLALLARPHMWLDQKRLAVIAEGSASSTIPPQLRSLDG